MANAILTKQINPIQLANNQKTLQGELPIAEMERLSGLISDPIEPVKFNLIFNRNALGYATMQGSINARFKVICQRCSLPMSLDLDIPLAVILVSTEEEAKRLSDEETIICGEESISLSAMLEEEILLNFPIVTRHPIKECAVKSSDFIELEEEEDKQNPFNIMKKLLRE